MDFDLNKFTKFATNRPFAFLVKEFQFNDTTFEILQTMTGSNFGFNNVLARYYLNIRNVTGCIGSVGLSAVYGDINTIYNLANIEQDKYKILPEHEILLQGLLSTYSICYYDQDNLKSIIPILQNILTALYPEPKLWEINDPVRIGFVKCIVELLIEDTDYDSGVNKHDLETLSTLTEKYFGHQDCEPGLWHRLVEEFYNHPFYAINTK